MDKSEYLQSLQKRLVKLRAGRSQEEFAQIIGTTRDNLSKYETRSTLPLNLVEPIAKATGVTVEYIVTGNSPASEQIKKSGEPGSDLTFNGDSYTPVRRFNLRAAAGQGIEAPGEPEVSQHVLFRKEWVQRIAGQTPVDHMAVMDVDGASMEPTLGDGDIVLVDQMQTSPAKRPGIYVINQDGELQIKRLEVHPASRLLYIRSDNPNFPSWPDVDPASIEIVGRVVWSGGER